MQLDSSLRWNDVVWDMALTEAALTMVLTLISPYSTFFREKFLHADFEDAAAAAEEQFVGIRVVCQ